MDSMRNRKWKQEFASLAAAVMTAMAIVLNLSVVKADVSAGDAASFLDKMSKSVGGNSYVLALIALGLFLCYRKWVGIEKESRYCGDYVMAVLLSLALLLGAAIQKGGTIGILYCKKIQIIKSLIYMFGWYFLFLFLLRILYTLLQKHRMDEFRSIHFLQKHPFAKSFVVISISWFPHLVIKYPGLLCYDNLNQIAQFFGMREFTTHHPPFHTVLLGSFVKLGQAMGHVNWGLFLFILVQCIFAIAVLSYSISFMGKCKSPDWLKYGALVLYAISPFYTGYVTIAVKDTLYSFSVLLFVICLGELIRKRSRFFSSKKNISLLTVSSILTILLRNNGIYIILPTLLIILLVILYKKLEKRQIFTVILMFVFILGLSKGIQGGLNHYYDIQPGSIREMLSVPFQQTARYVKYHKDEVTKEEAKAIEKVLDYKNLGDLYDARISDPVKATYKDNAEFSDLKEYFIVWAKQMMKHPITYLDATYSTVYSLFCPNVENVMYYEKTIDYYTAPTVYPDAVPALDSAKEGITSWYYFFHHIPLAGLLSNIGFYVDFMLILFFFAWRDGKTRELLLWIPPMLTLAICMVSPVVMFSPRYMFPIVYSMPVVLAGYLRAEKKDEMVLGRFLNSEAFRYLFIGVCTTLVNLAVFWFLTDIVGMVSNIQMTLANLTSVVISILFAYVTNKIYVFDSHVANLRELWLEFCKFVGARLFTLVIEVGGLYLLVNILGQGKMIGKLETQVLVIIGNYFISKWFVFKSKGQEGEDTLE